MCRQEQVDTTKGGCRLKGHPVPFDRSAYDQVSSRVWFITESTPECDVTSSQSEVVFNNSLYYGMWIDGGEGYFIENRYLESFLLLYPHFFILRAGFFFHAFFWSVMTRLWRMLISVGLPRVLFSTQLVGSFTSGFPSLLSFIPLDSFNVRHTFIQYYQFLFGRLFITGLSLVDWYPPCSLSDTRPATPP